jgi:DNA-binding beta-propeller fold protein YncE
MGKVKLDDGSVQRMDLDGSGLTTMVPIGGTFTAKQLKIDRKHGKLYWSDREGMRVMRSNLDGSKLETLIETGHGDEDRKDAKNWCVGIAVDTDKGKVYWTQKGGDNANQGTLRRANLEIPKGQDPAHRKDIEILFDKLPEPIDIDLDLSKRMIYWTDRGDPPRGNTVSRAPMDKRVAESEILFGGLKEGIGIALDVKGQRMFITDLGGNVYSANLDGSNHKTILTGQGALTGIAYAEVPKQLIVAHVRAGLSLHRLKSLCHRSSSKPLTASGGDFSLCSRGRFAYCCASGCWRCCSKYVSRKSSAGLCGSGISCTSSPKPINISSFA